MPTVDDLSTISALYTERSNIVQALEHFEHGGIITGMIVGSRPVPPVPPSEVQPPPAVPPGWTPDQENPVAPPQPEPPPPPPPPPDAPLLLSPVLVSTLDIAYPAQMVEGIKQQFNARLAAIDHELAGLGVSVT